MCEIGTSQTYQNIVENYGAEGGRNCRQSGNQSAHRDFDGFKTLIFLLVDLTWRLREKTARGNILI